MSSETEIVSFLMLIQIIFYFLCSLYFLVLKHKAKEDSARKRIMTIIGFIFFFIALSKLIHLIVIFLHGSAYFKDILSFENSFLFKFSQISLYTGIIGITFAFERRLEKFERNYATIVSSISCIIYFFIEYLYLFNLTDQNLKNIAKIGSYLFNGIIYIVTFILAFMYLRIALKTSGDVKRRSLFVFIGYFLLLLSYFVLILEEQLVSLALIAFISFIFGILGAIFLIFGYK